jgi:imidazolonepropionase-like amidohydrolase
VPAKLLGIADEVGTLAPGKRANLQVLTGDPLSSTTWVDLVVLDGETVYERSKDPRLQYLFGAGNEVDK